MIPLVTPHGCYDGGDSCPECSSYCAYTSMMHCTSTLLEKPFVRCCPDEKYVLSGIVNEFWVLRRCFQELHAELSPATLDNCTKASLAQCLQKQLHHVLW